MSKPRRNYPGQYPPAGSPGETLGAFAVMMVVFFSAVAGLPYLLVALAGLTGVGYLLSRR